MLSLGKASYWQNVKTVGALADFRDVWRAAGRRRWMFIILSGTTTIGVFSVMAQESWKGPPRKPQVTFINSWPAGRSDAEIIRTNIKNQKLQDRLRAEQAARNEKVKDIYRNIGRASGMDVEAIERKAKAEEAADKAAEQQAIGAAPIAASPIKTGPMAAGARQGAATTSAPAPISRPAPISPPVKGAAPVGQR